MNDDFDQKPPPENTGQEQAELENKGQFPPGKSGNPAGKPQGARNKTTLMCEKLMEGDAEDVVKAVIEKAKDGDVQAAKLILERLVPPRKGRPVRIDLPDVLAAMDIVEAHSAILMAASSGDITLEEASLFSGLIDGHRKAIETEELAKEVEAIKLAMKVK